ISTNGFWFYNGTTWTSVAGSLTLPFDASVNISGNAFRIANTSAAGVAIVGETDSNVGIFAKSNGSGTALIAMSNTGIAIDAVSSTNTVIQAANNSANPAISANNTNFAGVAIEANAANSTAILGISGGTSKSGIRGEATGNSGIGVFGTTSSATGYGMFATTGAGTAIYGTSTSGTGVRAISSTGLALDISGRVKIAGGNTNPSNGAILTSDASGNAVWKNNRIAFSVSGVNSTYNVAPHGSASRVHWKTEHYDYGNDYNLHVGSNPVSLSSTFTVPVTGVYHVDISITISGTDIGAASLYLGLNRSGTQSVIASDECVFIGEDYARGHLSRDIRLQAGDIIWVDAWQWSDSESAASIGTNGNYFNCHLIFQE
ncbi:MAG TPA: hypothetical protein VHM26_11660, partial [Chitinophagaceae bacterium]|nr:hypothetical protein [Chitinophagaceae bacterium]